MAFATESRTVVLLTQSTRHPSVSITQAGDEITLYVVSATNPSDKDSCASGSLAISRFAAVRANWVSAR